MIEIGEAELGIRARRLLKREGFIYLNELNKIPITNLLEIPQMGPKTIKEIQNALMNFGMSLDVTGFTITRVYIDWPAYEAYKKKCKNNYEEKTSPI